MLSLRMWLQRREGSIYERKIVKKVRIYESTDLRINKVDGCGGVAVLTDRHVAGQPKARSGLSSV
jgi:hypothetical protein